MKKYLFSIPAMFLILLLSSVAAFAADSDKHAEQTRQYKKQLNEWAKGAKEAREKARKAYENVTFKEVHAQVKKGFSSHSQIVEFEYEIQNSNDFPVSVDKIYDSYADGSHQIQGEFSFDGPGVIPARSSYKGKRALELRGVYDDFARDLKQGKAPLRLTVSRLKAVSPYEGTILSDGTPFKGKRPRDPYWLSSDELRYIKGEADSKNGIYEAAPPLPIIGGWFPIHSSSGSFSGSLPKMEEPRRRSQKEITNDFLKRSRKTLGYTEDTAQQTKDTGDSIKDVHDSIKGVLDLFN